MINEPSPVSALPRCPLPAPTAPVPTCGLANLLFGTSALTSPLPALAIMIIGLPLGLRPLALFADVVLLPHRRWSHEAVADRTRVAPRHCEATPDAQRDADTDRRIATAVLDAGPASPPPGTATPHAQREQRVQAGRGNPAEPPRPTPIATGTATPHAQRIDPPPASPIHPHPHALDRQHPMPSGNRGWLKNGAAPGDYLASPRCGARTRDGGACGQPAMPNGRCRLHGGKSTGARTEAGRARLRTLHTKHGGYGKEMQAHFHRMGALIADARHLLDSVRVKRRRAGTAAPSAMPVPATRPRPRRPAPGDGNTPCPADAALFALFATLGADPSPPAAISSSSHPAQPSELA